jgi:hypothetical protein
VKNKTQKWVFEALMDIRQRLPFALLGIDSDSGSEFINDHLYRYCGQEGITSTRAKSYRKNDNCFVEQKKYSVVRRAVGYLRYDTEEELLTLNDLYQHLRLYTNFFHPTMKLLEKTRNGSKVTKSMTLQRRLTGECLHQHTCLTNERKVLEGHYAKLNPAQLKRQITRLQQKLLRLNTLK